MKKLIIAAIAIGMVPSQGHTALAQIGLGCCEGLANDLRGCDHWYCTYNGVKTEYTNCATCTTAGTTPIKTGSSYEPCNDSGVLDVSYGKCENNTVIGPIVTLCKAGTYGENGVCTTCPTPGTSERGATQITDCYIPAGTQFSDDTGTGEYTEDCHYSNSISLDLGIDQ